MMNTRLVSLTLLPVFFALLFAPSLSLAQKDKDKKGKKEEVPKYKFKLTWETGKIYKYHYKFTIKTRQTNIAIGIPQEMQKYVDKDFSYKVESVDGNGVARLAVTCDAAKISIRHPTLGTVTYSSKNPPADLATLDNMVRADHFLVGKTFYAFMETNGKVRELEGAQQIIAQAFREAKYPKDAQDTEEQLKQQHTPESFIEMVELAFHNVPDNEVAMNETWSFDMSRDKGLCYLGTYRYSLTSLQNNVASIIVNAEMAYNPNPKPLTLSNGMQAKFAVRGRETGSVEIDQTTGFLKTKNTSQSLSGSLIYTGGSIGFMEVPVSTDTQIQIEPTY